MDYQRIPGPAGLTDCRDQQVHLLLHSQSPARSPQARSGRKNTQLSLAADGRIVCNDQIKEWLCELISGEGEAYGYKKLTHALGRNYGLVINKKKVYRLCKELDILRPQRKVKNKHPRRLARNRVITASNQLWETDLKYGYVAGEDRFFYIMSVIDVFDRSIIDKNSVRRLLEGKRLQAPVEFNPAAVNYPRVNIKRTLSCYSQEVLSGE